jgi:hypothetical protein
MRPFVIGHPVYLRDHLSENRVFGKKVEVEFLSTEDTSQSPLKEYIWLFTKRMDLFFESTVYSGKLFFITTRYGIDNYFFLHRR